MNNYIEQYKAYLQDVGNIGTRHENSRRFYLSVVSALFVFLSMAGADGPFHLVQGRVLTLVGLAGIMLCTVWLIHMQSFGALYHAKFNVLRLMEKEEALFPLFKEEWDRLRKDRRFTFLTLLDSVTPVLFALMFIAVLALK